jgi:hypothetical protein
MKQLKLSRIVVGLVFLVFGFSDFSRQQWTSGALALVAAFYFFAGAKAYDE